MLSLESLFCHVDDFCQQFELQWQKQLLGDGLRMRQRSRRLCLSEMMTILIAFHQSAYRNFKWFYTQLVCRCWRKAFPGLVSYHRFALVDAIDAHTFVCLFASVLWQVYGSQFH